MSGDLLSAQGGIGGGSMAIGASVGGGTVGSLLFVGAGGLLAQDNANLFYDDTNNIFGVGTAAPGLFTDTKLEVFRVGHCVMSIITVTAASDAILVLGTATAPNDMAMFLDESDGQKLKFALGDVNSDALRLSATKLTIQQNGNVGIGVSTIGNYKLAIVQPSIGEECIKLRATHVAGYSDMVWFDSSDVEKGGIGYANASVANTLAGKNFFYSPGSVDWIFSDGTADWLRIYATTNSVGLELANGSSGAASLANKGKLSYTTTGQKAQLSFNTGGYFDVATYAAAITSGLIPFANTVNQLAQDATFAWDNTNKQFQLGTPGASAVTTYRESVKGIASGSCLQLIGNGAAGYTGIDFYDSDTSPAAFKAAVIYGNSAVGITYMRGYFGVYSGGPDIAFANATQREHEWTMTAGSISYKVSGTKVLGIQGAAVVDASGGVVIDAEARTAINTLLARLRASTGHGLIA